MPQQRGLLHVLSECTALYCLVLQPVYMIVLHAKLQVSSAEMHYID